MTSNVKITTYLNATNDIMKKNQFFKSINRFVDLIKWEKSILKIDFFKRKINFSIKSIKNHYHYGVCYLKPTLAGKRGNFQWWKYCRVASLSYYYIRAIQHSSFTGQAICNLPYFYHLSPLPPYHHVGFNLPTRHPANALLYQSIPQIYIKRLDA